MITIRTAELATICGEFGLNLEILQPEDGSGPILVLTGGFPDAETLREINRRVFLTEPRIRKIVLELINDATPTNQP
jgi:hypothetical protein